MSARASSSFARLLRGVVPALVVAAVAGCASIGTPIESKTASSLEGLQLQPDGTRAWRDAGLGRPTALRIDPADVAFGPAVALNETERRHLREVLHQALVAHLGDVGFEVASRAGAPDRPSLHATITAVERAQPALNAVTTVLLFVPLSYGGLSVEIEAFEAGSGRRVAAMAIAGRAGLSDFGRSFSGLGHAEAQADVVAARFAAWLAAPATLDATGTASVGPLR